MRLFIAEDYQALSIMAAEMVAEQIKQKPNSILGLATGSTPLGMYQALIKMGQKGVISFKEVTTFNLDEYVGIPLDHPQSYHTYMKENLFAKIDIPMENTHIPSVAAVTEEAQEEQICKEYDRQIEEMGGIDLQILGIGSNGHIGFNEPAASLEAGTHIVALTQETREANARFFNHFDEVPTHAITMGVGSILKSRKILLLANGKNKAEVIAKMFSGDVNTQIPATLLQVHPDVTVIVDKEAASLLPQQVQNELLSPGI